MSEVMWSAVMWSEPMWFVWRDFVFKWSEVSYGEVVGDKSTMYIRVTFYWGYLFVLRLFHLVYILYCGGFNLFCNVWVFWQLYGRFCNTYTCIYCVLYCLYRVFVLFRLCTFILICFICTTVRTTATEWQLNCRNNNNNNNNFEALSAQHTVETQCTVL